jgi:hypothetical protein
MPHTDCLEFLVFLEPIKHHLPDQLTRPVVTRQGDLTQTGISEYTKRIRHKEQGTRRRQPLELGPVIGHGTELMPKDIVGVGGLESGQVGTERG